MATILLHVDLHQKFRAFGIDFGKVDFVHDVPLPVPADLLPAPMSLLSFSQKGLTLNLSLTTGTAASPAPSPSLPSVPVVKIAPVVDIYGNPLGTTYTMGADGQPIKIPMDAAAQPTPTNLAG